MADKKKLYKDEYGQRYVTPSQPSLDTMQQVAIPDYRIQQTYAGSHARPDTPNTVYLDPRDFDEYAGKEGVRAHELQHQIGYLPRAKGQAKSLKDSRYASSIDEAWAENAKRLGMTPRGSYHALGNSLKAPEVQARLKELNWSPDSRLRREPDKQDLTELLADLSGLESSKKLDLTKDPVFKKHVFNDDNLRKLYKSTSGMSGVVIGDSDYAPYSLEAGEAWSGREPTGLERLKGMIGYKAGGLTNLAKELEKSGRGKDQMLVHMTPREVAGLQAIAKAHGGSLTVNPDTGLVEAGFLDNLLPSLLPTIAGVALASTGIGAPAAAMLVGGGYGLATGSVEKGLMAGLGAYGGAGIGESLAANATTQAATNAAQAGVIPQATTVGGTAMTPGVDAGTQALGAASGNAPVATTQMPYAPNATGQISPAVTAAQTGTTAPTAPAQGFTFDQLKSGYANTDLTKFAGQNYGKIGMAAAPAVSAAMEPKPYEEPEKKKYSSGYTLSPDFQGYVPQRPNPYYTPTGLGYAGGGQIPQLNHMAPGGLAALQGMRDGYDTPVTNLGEEQQFVGGGDVKKKDPKAKLTGARSIALMDPLDASMAELNNARYGANLSQTAMPKTGIAGLGALPYAAGGMAQGRYLSGGGDGMSDSIPATINGKQPARLADGEFVIPADVVSHLGNGSSDAGAKKLYAMMDKIRTARTGKKKQAPAVNPNKYMPA